MTAVIQKKEPGDIGAIIRGEVRVCLFDQYGNIGATNRNISSLEIHGPISSS